MLKYDMWVVIPDKHIDCPCKNFETKQANAFCPNCLGTGYKIKIRKIKGVRQPTTMSAQGMQFNVETGVYFFRTDYDLKEGDIIIWDDEVDEVTRTDRFCSDAQKPVYFRCDTKPKKTNIDRFLDIFYRVILKKPRQRRR